jgi:hypothetical protein
LLLGEALGDAHQWECVLDDPAVASRFGGFDNKIVHIEGVENVNNFLEINGAESGKSTLILDGAVITTGEITAQYEDVIRIVPYNPDEGRTETMTAGLKGAKPPKMGRRRRLASPIGTLDTLVVRVNALDVQPPAATALSEDIFGDEYCLKTQYDRCSYGQLQIKEYVPGPDGGGISNVQTAVNAPGVVDIYIQKNAGGNTKEQFQSDANAALQALLGVSDPSTLFDLVMFCFPPNLSSGSWLGYAYINRWDSYFNNDWCQAMSSQMHEVGHSIGLHHSGEYEGSDSVKEYGDQTGMMGYSYRQDDTPKMCFNPAKNWQLGWFDDKHIDVKANNLSQDPTSYTLNGVVDYDTISPGAGIVLKINNYYIGYNRATEFNGDVLEAANQVTVIEKLGSPGSSARSKLAQKMNIGDKYDIEITSLLTVTVKYASNANGKDAVIELSLEGEAVQCQGEYDAEIVVELTTDNYPSETTWAIVDNFGLEVYRKDTYSSAGSFSDTVQGLCRGLEYYFVIEDEYGDGICCSWGQGSFTGKYGDLILFNGGADFAILQIPFTLPLGPTSNPTASPTQLFCSTEVQECDDGSYVSRDPGNGCKFKECPTADPTLNPTANPTTSPTTSPTSSPTVSDEVTPNSCSDDSNFLYRNKKNKDCSWVKKKSKRKTKIICLRRAKAKPNRTRVWEYCKETCDWAGVNKAC